MFYYLEICTHFFNTKSYTLRSVPSSLRLSFSYLITAWEMLWAVARIDLASFPLLNLLSSTRPPTRVPAMTRYHGVRIKECGSMIKDQVTRMKDLGCGPRINYKRLSSKLKKSCSFDFGPAVYVQVMLWLALHVVKFTSSYTWTSLWYTSLKKVRSCSRHYNPVHCWYCPVYSTSWFLDLTQTSLKWWYKSAPFNFQQALWVTENYF